MKSIILFLFLMIGLNLYGYDIIYTGGSIGAGKLLIGDYDSSVLINNSFSAYRDKNSIAISGSKSGGTFLEAEEQIFNYSAIASVVALKKYVNIDIAFNMFSYNFYKNYIFYFGLSRKIIDTLGVGVVFKYGGESFNLTYDNEVDPLFTGNNLSENNYNFDLSVSYNYNDMVISGLSFENILSYEEFVKNTTVYDLPAVIRVNIMVKMFNFFIFNNNFVGSEIEISRENMSIKTGTSLGLYKYFSFKLGYVSNEAITTGVGVKIKAGGFKFYIDYGLDYTYNINGINNIITIKTKY